MPIIFHDSTLLLRPLIWVCSSIKRMRSKPQQMINRIVGKVCLGCCFVCREYEGIRLLKERLGAHSDHDHPKVKLLHEDIFRDCCQDDYERESASYILLSGLI